MGGKKILAKKLLPILDAAGRVYVEPFAGGMNVIEHVVDAKRRIANDSNHYVMAMFKELLSGWVPEFVTREDYARLKKLHGEDHEIGWAGTACSFRGSWFAGYAGVSVEKKAGTVNYQARRLRSVLKQVERLEGVELSSGDYRDMDIPDGAVVYCDPPYRDTKSYKDSFDHDAFFDWCRALSGRCDVFISEYSAPPDFRVVDAFPHKSVFSPVKEGQTAKHTVEKVFVYDKRVLGL